MAERGARGPPRDFKRLFTISEYYDCDLPAFYRAIQSVRERGMDLTGWLEYFTEGLAAQLGEVQARGERTIRRDVLAREHGLSDLQALALGHVPEHGRLTIQEYEALCPGANRRTLQRDLRDLVEKGLLATEGQTNASNTLRERDLDELATDSRHGLRQTCDRTRATIGEVAEHGRRDVPGTRLAMMWAWMVRLLRTMRPAARPRGAGGLRPVARHTMKIELSIFDFHGTVEA